MRNKGFFWFFTIVLLVASLYQISFTFIGNKVEKQAETEAISVVEELIATTPKGDSVRLPNDTYVNFETDNEAYDLAKAAFINDILKKKNDKKVFLGNTYSEVKDKGVALGLDLEGGMSVTLQLSMPDLLKNEAQNQNDLHFLKPFEVALQEYNTVGGDFIDIFTQKHKEIFPDRPLIREFSTEKVISEISNKASDSDVKSYLRELSKGAIDGVETVMENRINQFGVAQPNMTKDKETNRLYIELPGVKDQATLSQRLQSTANLEFYLTYKSMELGGLFNELIVEKDADALDNDLDDLFADNEDSTDNISEEIDTTNAEEDDLEVSDATDAETLAEDDLSFEEEDVTLNEEEAPKLSSFVKIFKVNVDADNRYPNSPALGFALAKDTARVNELVQEKADELLIDDARFVWGARPTDIGIQDSLYYTLYAMKVPDDGKARVGGTDIRKARVSFDDVRAERGVSVEMNDRGSEEWGRMTSENVGNFIAITMDNKVYSAPVINGPITGGNTLISGSFTVAEAQGLTDLLNAGSLPAPMVIVDQAVVGPTIGAQNAKTGLLSFAFALCLVLVYMVFYYGKAGLVADFALVINIVLLVGFLAAFGAVLTLAGIAGIVLTMGMSVDANVLIFERAREEIREGKGMKAIIKDGYANALPSIIDANVTTLLTAIVLKIFGSGPIESFATTLIIGIFTSVFTAVVVTRLVFEWALKKKKTFKFSIPATANVFANANFNFVSNRKKFYIFSGTLILIGIIALSVRGIKPSVEFAGGRTYETVFTEPVGKNVETLKQVLRDNLKQDGIPASVEVKSRNSDYRIEIATDYLQGLPNAEIQAEKDLLTALSAYEAEFGTASVVNSRSISPTISAELKRSSAIAVGLALVIIFVYILIRFGRWQFGFGATVALAHDVTIVLGIFALLHDYLPFSMELDQAFIAAVLTIIGYSINDTVVVFDRVREFLRIHPKDNVKKTINDAINSTLGRTMNTAMTTFIVLSVIFIFDEGAIKGFIFALMIGVVIGTYSSICVATPIVVDLLSKEEKERGRLAENEKIVE